MNVKYYTFDFHQTASVALQRLLVFFMSFLSHMSCFHSAMFSFSASYDLIDRCLSSGVSDGWMERFVTHSRVMCTVVVLPLALGERPLSTTEL